MKKDDHTEHFEDEDLIDVEQVNKSASQAINQCPEARLVLEVTQDLLEKGLNRLAQIELERILGSLALSKLSDSCPRSPNWEDN